MAAGIPGGPLSSARLANWMLQCLPSKDGNLINTPAEAIALVAHACFLAVDFRLIGLDEDHRIESSPEPTLALPAEWNSHKNISFKYAHSQSSMQFLLTISRLGTKAVINGLALGDEKVASLDIPLDDFISPSALPYTPGADRTSIEASHKIQQIFISPGRIVDFASMLKTQLIQKLAPRLQKEGYEDTSSTTNAHTQAEDISSNRDQRQDIDDRERAPGRRPQDPLPPPARPHPFDDPLADYPRRGGGPIPDFAPPGFEDEHGILRAPGRGGFGGPGGLRGPNIGERDLYPQGMGPHDPLRIGPERGGYRGGGGMYPAFDDPLFDGRGGQGGGFNPSAPPGARYDPVGPGDGVPRDPMANRRFPGGNGQGGFGGPANPFGGFGGNDFI